MRGRGQRRALRIGDAEREEAVVRLREHHVAGRLDVLEFQQRMGQALSAKTSSDLPPLFADLPRLRHRPAVRLHRPGRRVRLRRGVALSLGALSLATNGVLFAVLHEADEADEAYGDSIRVVRADDEVEPGSRTVPGSQP